MNRHVKAFLIAPLIVPGLMLLLFFLPLLARSRAWGLTLLIAVVVSYVGVFLFGAPAYMVLRSRGWTSFWISPLIGFVAACVTGVLAMPFVVSLTTGRAPRFLPLTDMLDPSMGLLGVYGASVGALLWIIGRPDRP